MVYKLRPAEMKIDFEDREYRLGDTIDVDIELAPVSDVAVRRARIELVCEERFVESFGFSGPGMYASSGVGSPVSQIPSQVTKERKETYVHSATSVLDGASLRSGVPTSHRGVLRIEHKPPVHLEDSKELHADSSRSWTFKWTLVATLDVVRGRNPRRQRVVNVKVT